MLPEEPLLSRLSLSENPTRDLIFRLTITIIVLLVVSRIAS